MPAEDEKDLIRGQLNDDAYLAQQLAETKSEIARADDGTGQLRRADVVIVALLAVLLPAIVMAISLADQPYVLD